MGAPTDWHRRSPLVVSASAIACAVLMGNRIEWVELTVALLKLGALTVPLNTRYSAPEIGFVVGNADCVMAVTEEVMAVGLSVVRAQQPVCRSTSPKTSTSCPTRPTRLVRPPRPPMPRTSATRPAPRATRRAQS